MTIEEKMKELEARKLLAIKLNNTDMANLFMEIYDFLDELKKKNIEGGYANDGQYIKIDYYCTSCGSHITNRMGCPNSDCRGKQILL